MSIPTSPPFCNSFSSLSVSTPKTRRRNSLALSPNTLDNISHRRASVDVSNARLATDYLPSEQSPSLSPLHHPFQPLVKSDLNPFGRRASVHIGTLISPNLGPRNSITGYNAYNNHFQQDTTHPTSPSQELNLPILAQRNSLIKPTLATIVRAPSSPTSMEEGSASSEPYKQSLHDFSFPSQPKERYTPQQRRRLPLSKTSAQLEIPPFRKNESISPIKTLILKSPRLVDTTPTKTEEKHGSTIDRLANTFAEVQKKKKALKQISFSSSIEEFSNSSRSGRLIINTQLETAILEKEDDSDNEAIHKDDHLGLKIVCDTRDPVADVKDFSPLRKIVEENKRMMLETKDSFVSHRNVLPPSPLIIKHQNRTLPSIGHTIKKL